MTDGNWLFKNRKMRSSLERRIEALEAKAEAVTDQRLAKIESVLRHQASLQIHAACEVPKSIYEESWRQLLPRFLNAVTTVGGFGYDLAQIKRDISARQEKSEEIQNEVKEIAYTVENLQAKTARLETLSDHATHLENELKNLWQKNGDVDREFRGLWDKGAAVDLEFKNLWNKAGAVDREITNVWNKAGSFDGELANLWHRLEFVRREILFEMSAEHAARQSSLIQPRILDPEKVNAARQNGARLNIGCGHVPLDGFVNIDGRDLPGVSIVAEVGHLPFEKGAVTEIFSAHLLEHFTEEELRRRLLPYWVSLLAPGGVFRAIVPDGEAMLKQLSDGAYSFEDFKSVLFGGQDYKGDFHFNMFTPESLTRLLAEAGLNEIHTPITGRRNGLCYEFEIVAHNPEAGLANRRSHYDQ
jgi:hypothetical protein